MNSYITTIEIKQSTATEFANIDQFLKEASFICDKKDTHSKTKKCDRSGVYIKKGSSLSLNEVSTFLVTTLYKSGKKYSFTVIKDKFRQ